MSKRHLFSYVVGLVIATFVQASTTVEILPVNVDVRDQAKLQRGAKIFMNYCSGCHALRYMRYNRMAEDLGLTTFTGEIDKDLLFNNLVFTTAKIHDPIQISMPPTDARQWFGIVPPDLSLTARERGPEWIYTYLKSFYEDKKRPFGTNNLLVPDVAMPNILEPLMGRIIAVRESQSATSPVSHLVLVESGEMTLRQFDSMLEDLVTFLTYVAEPVKLIRYRLGIMVILFLCVFWVVAYQLKRIYWKKIH
ncbi:cytochrome c1 [Legionella clemsonensis]|uniref:Cytochrome c1 n=1 Tax=Legionella clemsonensis TaxID=1867846 RepID=A0A222NZS6_9GAMM|nr:cytochrome c1 [Legionella clemsonensis]ASQ45076.1 Cytochrome c1 precursor [Legionella clemsonensis]